MSTAIITGAGRGIGLKIAEYLLEKDFNAALAARNMSDGVKKLQAQYGERCIFVSTDISVQSDREKLINTTAGTFGSIDLLVNNAGVAPRERKDMLAITEDDYDYVMDINLKGTYFLTQSAANIMKNSGGRIVNIGSISADTVSLNRAEYCMSKAGVEMLTKLFAVRLAEYGITVFEVRPGVIDTDMISTVREKYMNLAASGAIPAGRLGTADDIARAVMSIADGALDYATGTVIHCGGGMNIPVL